MATEYRDEQMSAFAQLNQLIQLDNFKKVRKTTPIFRGGHFPGNIVLNVKSRNILKMLRSLLKFPGSGLSQTQSSLCKSYSTAGPGRGPVGDQNAKRMRSTVYYFGATAVLTLGFSYAAVPLYRMFCQASGYGGTTGATHDPSKVEGMKARKERQFKIKFNADTGASMRWNFKPQQNEIKVFPGETALAFYTAKNPTDKPVIGISTYNVIPFEAGLYFNKIQCFCFEEQQLNPNEEVDMPVFFYIDPDICDDPKLEFCEDIILSYTFFEAKEGMNLVMPSYATAHK